MKKLTQTADSVVSVAPPKSENNAESSADVLAEIQVAMSFDAEITMAPLKSAKGALVLMPSGGAYTASIDDIRLLPGFNPRIKNRDDYEAHIRYLMASIEANGYYANEPIACIAVKEGGKVLLYAYDGHCRLEALARLRARGFVMDEVDIALAPIGTTLEDLHVAVITTARGKALAPVELAIMVKRMHGYKWTVGKIAEKFCYSEEYIKQLLELAGAPLSIREMVESGQATAATAIAAIRTHGSEAKEVLDVALIAAKAAGKKGITAKFMPEKIRTNKLQKSGPAMFDVLEAIVAEPVFDSLPDALREKIIAVLSDVQALDAQLAEKKASTAAQLSMDI